MRGLIVVPCYNEEEIVKIFYDTTKKEISEIKDVDFDILFVLDGCKDNTLLKVKELEGAKYISFSRNFGKEAAMYAGLKRSVKDAYDFTIYMDADLQDNPKYIKNLINEYKKGYKLVNTRFPKEKFSITGIPRRLFYKLYAKMTGDNSLKDGLRDFALIDNASVGKALLSFKEPKRFLKGLYNYVGFKRIILEIEEGKRVAGVSKWGFFKLLKYAFDGLYSFSNFYNILFNFLMVLSFLLFGVDLGLHLWQSWGNLNWLTLIDEVKISFFILFITICLNSLVHFLTSVNNDIRKREYYFIEEEV